LALRIEPFRGDHSVSARSRACARCSSAHRPACLVALRHLERGVDPFSAATWP
jgi:hypothetical protein